MNVPLKTSRDASKIRKEYLANLALSASNDQLNLNAQKMFKSTGASSLLADNITKTEKVMGSEGYKQLARDFLSGANILTSYAASDVTQQLSPDDNQFIFQYKDFIENDFKGREVPSVVFKAYIQKLRKKIETTEGVDFGLQQSGSGLITTPLAILGDYDLRRIDRALQGKPEKPRIMALLDRLKRLPLDEEEIANLEIIDPVRKDDVMIRNSAILGQIPTVERLISAIERNDAAEIEDLASFTPNLELSSEDMRHILEEGIQEARVVESPFQIEPPRQQNLLLDKLAYAEEEDEVEPYIEDAAAAQQAAAEPVEDLPLDEEKKRFEALSDFEKRRYLLKKFSRLTMEGLNTKEEEGQSLLDILVELTAFFKQGPPILEEGEILEERQQVVPKGSGMRGRGLGKKIATRNRQATPVERSTGYEKPKSYRQFGRHLINTDKLKDGIFMLKYPSGAVIKELPTQKISGPLKNVLRTIIEGGQPTQSQFEGMGIEDREKLHHIVRHTRVGIEAPHPHEEEHDEEHTRFEILKGEILASNDNVSIIKEFKKMLIKFIREGRISKREGNEILEEMLHLGV